MINLGKLKEIHGKVFEDDGDRVWIWDKVEETLMKYKNSFYVEEA